MFKEEKLVSYETLCKLSRERAIQIISNTETVMYKSGVWNQYTISPTELVIIRIKRSPYGASVKRERATGVLYVCTPTESDMW